MRSLRPPSGAGGCFSCLRSLRHGAQVQPPDGIERGSNGPSLPAPEIRGVFAGQRNPAVDLAQVLVVPGASIGGPHSKTTHGERRTMPGNGNAVVELFAILRV